MAKILDEAADTTEETQDAAAAAAAAAADGDDDDDNDDDDCDCACRWRKIIVRRKRLIECRKCASVCKCVQS